MDNIPNDPSRSAPRDAQSPGKPGTPDTPGALEKKRWFEDEVHVHDAKLKSYLRSLFPTIDVDDVVQESYLRIWLANATRPVTSAKAYLFTIARRLAFNTVRHQKKSPVTSVSDLTTLEGVIDESKDTVETVAASEEIALLAEAINSLPPRCREIILLRKLKGVPQRKVAALFDTTEAAVGQQVRRGIIRLEAFFTERGMIEPRGRTKHEKKL